MKDIEKSTFGSVRHRGKTYSARYKHKGVEYSKTCKTLAMAYLWLEKEKALIDTEQWKKPFKRVKDQKQENMTFNEFGEIFLKGKSALVKTTVDSYNGIIKKYLNPYFGKMKLLDITADDIREFYTTFNMIRKYDYFILHLLKRMLNEAKEQKLISENPFILKLKMPKMKHKMVILDYEDIEKANALMLDRYKIAIYLGCYFGLRIGEMGGLQRKHVNLEKQTITVIQQLQKDGLRGLKSEKSARVIPIPAKLLPLIIQHLNDWVECDPEAFILTNKRKNPCKKYTLEEEWVKARQALPAEKRECRIHDWRHTYATNLLKAEVPIKTTIGLLGHSKIDMSLYYQELETPDKIRGVEKLNDIIPIAETEIIKPKPIKEIEEFVREHTKITFDLETEEKTEKMTLEGTNEEAEEFHEISTRTLGEIEKLLNEELLKMTPEERLKFEERRKERSRQETLKALRLGKITREEALKILI